MSFRHTLIFAGILVLLAGYIVFLKMSKPEEKWAEPPEVWSVEEGQVERISVQLPHKNKQISFFLNRKEDKWHIDDAKKTPVDLKRWGGIVMLVSGPQSKKMLAKKIDNLEEFGLSEPQMIITLGVRNQKDPLEILFGERTPNKKHFYVKLRHGDPVYLIADTFCEVLMRLATEPPLIKSGREAEGKK